MAKDEPYIIFGGEVTFVPDIEGKETSSAWGTIALLAFGLGLIAISIHWVAALNPPLWALIVTMAVGTASIALGAPSSLGLVTGGDWFGKDYNGFCGLLLGAATIILSCTMYVLTGLLIWG